jgi:hypothetical protein
MVAKHYWGDIIAMRESMLTGRCLEAGCIISLFYCCLRVMQGVYRAVAYQCADMSHYVYKVNTRYNELIRGKGALYRRCTIWSSEVVFRELHQRMLSQCT